MGPNYSLKRTAAYRWLCYYAVRGSGRLAQALGLMTLRFLALVAIAIAACNPVRASAQIGATIAFFPNQPTTNDSIRVAYTPAPGQLDRCPLNYTIGTGWVFIISSPCPVGYGSNNRAVIGKLRAGTYQVTWGTVDNFFNEPEPTATLVVTSAPAQIPTLSALGMLLLGSCLVFFLRVLAPAMSPNYSLKRTFAG